MLNENFGVRACHSPYGITAKPESVSVSIGTPAFVLCAGSRNNLEFLAAG